MTFSPLARDPESGALGGASATGDLCVGAWVLRGRAGIGVTASQGHYPSIIWGESVLPKFTNQVQHRVCSGVAMGKHYQQFDLDDRIELSRLYEAGTARSEIARIMGRHPSTIGRELRRNSLPKAGYKPAAADHMAFTRRKRQSKIERLSPLGKHVRDHLAMGWSPEQIAGRLRRTGAEHSATSRSTASSTAGRCAARSCTATWRGQRRAEGAAISSGGVNRSPAVAPSTNAAKPLITDRSSAIGRVISCSFAPNAETSSPWSSARAD